MFHFDRGLKLTKADLAIDFCRRQPRGFISHAHADHMARHEYALCTPDTARLYHLRLGHRPVLEMPYRETIDWGGLRLTTLPAGHCLGSAMLLAEDDAGQRLLYTGDFKLRESATAERAELPRADVLVIESTYGTPAYRLPPRDEAIAQLVDIVRTALERDQTPVVKAYALGKSQEVTRILTSHGFAVVQHPQVHAVSQVYEACGVPLGDYACVGHSVPAGKVLVTPPLTRSGGRTIRVERPVTIGVTGWAIDARTRFRLRADHAVPLSDHADYDELFEAVERVAPREVYCTHGPVEFADRLREAGWNAFRLGAPHRQMRLPGVA